MAKQHRHSIIGGWRPRCETPLATTWLCSGRPVGESPMIGRDRMMGRELREALPSLAMTLSELDQLICIPKRRALGWLHEEKISLYGFEIIVGT
jgi:hypothetical protein